MVTAQLLQPSLGLLFPSSQNSPKGECKTPSPHSGSAKHTFGLGHVKSASTKQFAEQPLPTLGASQVSPASITLLPQTDDAVGSGENPVQLALQPFTPGTSQISPGSSVPLLQPLVLEQVLGVPLHA